MAGGDYQDIRHIRVAMKAARKVRVRGIARIADRSFNSTPSSTAAAKLYFTKDLREMALTGVPGEIYPPEEEDIAIKWGEQHRCGNLHERSALRVSGQNHHRHRD